MNAMYTPQIEFQPLEKIRAFQVEKMKETLNYLQRFSPFYQRMFAREKIEAESLRTESDFRKIPFTEKQDLQLFNEDFLCVERNKITDYITTSGTLGEPVTFAMTDGDLDRLAYNEAISFVGAGGHAGEVYQLMTTMDKRFMAGLAYFLGIRRMGASIIRVGNGIPELQWDTIQRVKPDCIIVVPSFILQIVKYAEAHGIDYKKSSVKKAICIGENLREQDFSLNLLGQKIKEKWDIELFSTFASTEMSTSFTECHQKHGGHLHPELIYAELINEKGQRVKTGEYGELVVTTFGVQAMPLLRYKTGDICRFHYEACPCGRTTPRISPIVCRKNQMIKYKGTTLYPYAIFDVLDQLENVENYLVIVSSNDCGTDEVKIQIGTNKPDEHFVKNLKDTFRAKIRVAPDIELTSVDEIRKIQNVDLKRKPVKFIDQRKKLIPYEL